MSSGSSRRLAGGLAGAAVMALAAGCFPQEHVVGELSFDAGATGGTGGRMAAGGSGGAGGSIVDAMAAGGTGACAGPLAFADPDVEAFVRAAISLPTGPIFAADVAGLTTLNLLFATIPAPCQSEGSYDGCIDYVSPPSVDGWITSLSGVECLTAVESLSVDAFQLNLEPLRALAHLNTLFLGPVPGSMPPPLPQVKSLECGGMSAHGFLSAFPGLTSLTVSGVSESDGLALDEVAGAAGLTKLSLRSCGLTDISPLSKLANLTELDLSNNAITDLGPLVANAGLGAGDVIYVSGSSPTALGIDCAAQAPNIALLRSRGVTIQTDCP